MDLALLIRNALLHRPSPQEASADSARIKDIPFGFQGEKDTTIAPRDGHLGNVLRQAGGIPPDGFPLADIKLVGPATGWMLFIRGSAKAGQPEVVTPVCHA